MPPIAPRNLGDVIWQHLRGTLRTAFAIGQAQLTTTSTYFSVRNAGDTAYLRMKGAAPVDPEDFVTLGSIGPGGGTQQLPDYYFVDPTLPDDVTVRRYQTAALALAAADVAGETLPELMFAAGRDHYLGDGTGFDLGFDGIAINVAQGTDQQYQTAIWFNDAGGTVPFTLAPLAGNCVLTIANAQLQADFIGAGVGCTVTIGQGWSLRFQTCEAYDAPIAWVMDDCNLLQFQACKLRATPGAGEPTGSTAWFMATAGFPALVFNGGTTGVFERTNDHVIDFTGSGAPSVSFGDSVITWIATDVASHFIESPRNALLEWDSLQLTADLAGGLTYMLVNTTPADSNGWTSQNFRLLPCDPAGGLAPRLELGGPGTISGFVFDNSITFLPSASLPPSSGSAVIPGTRGAWQAVPVGGDAGAYGLGLSGGVYFQGLAGTSTDRGQWVGADGFVRFTGATTNAAQTANLTQVLDPTLDLYRLDTSGGVERQYDVEIRASAFRASATDGAELVINARLGVDVAGVVSIVFQNTSAAIFANPPATFTAALAVVAADGFQIQVDQGAVVGGNTSWDASVTKCTARVVT